MLRVGFIGLGKMGLPMCRNLLKAGLPLVVHNRSPRAVQELVAAGATPASSPAEVASSVDIVLTCLPDVPAVQLVYQGPNGVLSKARPGLLMVDHSTVSPDLSRGLYQAAKKQWAAFLDAPVSGGTAGAAAGTLTIMVGGDEAPFLQARPVLEGMGKNIHHVGPSGSGTIIKLANQLLVGIHSAATAEALALITAAGGDAEVAAKVIATSFGASNIFNRNAAMVLDRNFGGGTPVNLLLKDLKLIAETAEGSSVRLLMGGMARQVFSEAAIQGLGQQDISAMVQPLEKLANITVTRRDAKPS